MNQDWIETEILAFIRRTLSHQINQYLHGCDRFELEKAKMDERRLDQEKIVKTVKTVNLKKSA